MGFIFFQVKNFVVRFLVFKQALLAEKMQKNTGISSKNLKFTEYYSL